MRKKLKIIVPEWERYFASPLEAYLPITLSPF
jgi:hypothetical protein